MPYYVDALKQGQYQNAADTISSMSTIGALNSLADAPTIGIKPPTKSVWTWNKIKLSNDSYQPQK